MAVYTEVPEDELEAFIAEYDIGKLSACKGIAEGVENSNFMLQTDRGTYFLTLYEKRVRREDLPYFLGLMEHLAQRGLPSPTPIHGRDGRALREVAGRPAAIITFLSGVWPRKPQPLHCAEIGRALAQLHLAGADFALRRENDLSVAGWRRLLDACAGRADEVRHDLAKELEQEWNELKKAWPQDLPAGVVHADLFPDNALFLDNKLSGMIDFYFACNDYFAYDIAVCMNAWCFESDGAFNVTKARLLLHNYQKGRALSPAELAALPLLCRGAALRFLLTRLYDWLNQVPGAMVKPKDPMEYWRKLLFHRGIRGVGEYGLA